MVDDAVTFRTKDQVLKDLSKALGFSTESLQANRRGRLSKDQTLQLSLLCIRPTVLTAVFAAAPFLIWTAVTANQQQLSFSAAFPALLADLAHAKCLFETHGKLIAIAMLGSILVSLGVAALMFTRIPVRLYFDLLDGKVEVREGRVTRREEQTNRPNGRDPIEKYFFCLRYLNMRVNLAAYRALEDGSIYVLYLLPRSEVLASIEPRIEGKMAPKEAVKENKNEATEETATEGKVEPAAVNAVPAAENASPQ